jgi:uncharacterized protein YlxW (UPF0749 family)
MRQQLMLLVIMLLIGFIIMNHIRSVDATDASSSLIQQYQERQKELKKLEEQYETLLAENDRLNIRKAEINDEVLNRQGNEQMVAELAKIRILAGFTEVRGTGIILTLNDKVGYNILEDTDDSLVHDSDIRHAIDLLRNAGAAAISVNGMRITNSSFVKCIGPTIRCNKQRLIPPYVILALGDPILLSDALASDQMFNQRKAAPVDLIVDVQVEAEVIIPAFNEADNYYAYISLLEEAQP